VLHAAADAAFGGCRWTWRMWATFAAPALISTALIWVYGVERHRWRYGYYHVHQAALWLRDDDPAVRWRALDHISNVRFLLCADAPALAPVALYPPSSVPMHTLAGR
jgi:hypothetical protein